MAYGRARSDRRSIDLVDYRRAMGRNEDVAVGAFARAERRRHVYVALAGLALLGGAVGLYFVVRHSMAADRPVEGQVLVRCIKCGREDARVVKPGTADESFWCPSCGERSARKLWVCRACGTIFVPTSKERNKESDQPSESVDPEHLMCPACKSRQVGTAEPGRPGM